jgi:superfamily II helicase
MSKLPDSMYDYRYELPLAKVVDVCKVCNRYIFEGESYYDFAGDVVCKDCSRDYVKEHKTR